MEHKESKRIPEHMKESITHKSCDICKRLDIGRDRCKMDETDVSFRDVEYSYPECSKWKTYSYDICHDCFEGKLMPALSELGAEPRIEEYDD